MLLKREMLSFDCNHYNFSGTPDTEVAQVRVCQLPVLGEGYFENKSL